jgi:hypothetical protein
MAHSALTWTGDRLRRRVAGEATARTASAAVKRRAPAVAAKTAVGASGIGAAALVGVELARAGIKGAARARRRLEDAATPLVVNGRGGAGARPRMGGPSGLDGVKSALAAARSAPAETPRPPRPAPTADGRRYTHWRTGEAVRVASSKIILPRGWDRERRP